jgi:hypothetical protein
MTSVGATANEGGLIRLLVQVVFGMSTQDGVPHGMARCELAGRTKAGRPSGSTVTGGRGGGAGR